MSLDEDFNTFAASVLNMDQRPRSPEVSLLSKVVTVRTFSFPPAKRTKYVPIPFVPEEEEEGVGCCLYPWPDPDGTPLYPYTDLPATVVYGGETLTRMSNGFTEYYYESASYYIDAEDSTTWQVHRLSDSGVEKNSTCLIDGVDVEDDFENTYTVTGNNGLHGDTQTITVTRVSLCQWEGTDACGNPVVLAYFNSGIEGEKPAWTVAGSSYAEESATCEDRASAQASKDDPQSAPDSDGGTYTHVGTDAIDWNVA